MSADPAGGAALEARGLDVLYGDSADLAVQMFNGDEPVNGSDLTTTIQTIGYHTKGETLE